jgi:DNA-binding MarR family transcriptional regulator
MTKRQGSRPLAAKDYAVLARFRFLLRGFVAFSEEAARAAGLTPQQHQALLAIRGFSTPQGFAVGDLAHRLQIRHHSAVGLADRLEEAGLLKRKSDPEDGRRVRLELTAKAERLLARLTAIHRDELRRLSKDLKPLLAAL